MKKLIVLASALVALLASASASAQRAPTPPRPHTEETTERPGVDRLATLLAVVTERSCVTGSPVVLIGRVVDCIESPVVAQRHHHSRRHHSHHSRRRVQPVDQMVLAAQLLAQRPVANERSARWTRLGSLRAQLEGVNASDPRVDGMLTEAASILRSLGYTIERDPGTAPSMVASADLPRH